MISKNRIKLIHSLEKKKFRRQEGLFVAEGPKLVGELLPTFTLRYVAATATWYDTWGSTLAGKDMVQDLVTDDELRKASLLQHPQEVIALFELPHSDCPLQEVADKELVLALDGIQDPGNMGTIVRIADWFGINHIYCSQETVDVFTPKAIQATMGAIGRVNVHYVNLVEQLNGFQGKIYGTELDGDNLYGQELTQRGVIIMGNEGNGISKGVRPLVNSHLLIPSFPSSRETVESLNVAIATAIICAEFRRTI